SKNVMPPMHHVKRRRTVCFCTFDGCRCSHTLPDTIRIRLRGVSSYPCLNIDCQACESVIWRLVSFQSNLAIRYHPLKLPGAARGGRPPQSEQIHRKRFQFLRLYRKPASNRAPAYLIMPELCNKGDQLSRDFPFSYPGFLSP